MSTLQISAKTLAGLALTDACPRCLWLKMKLNFKLPYQIFPGIFSSIDSYSKKITAMHQLKLTCAPPWMEPFGKLGVPIKVPHHSKFRFEDKATGILLTGGPDEIFQAIDKTLFIVDYKTSRYTATQDTLAPMYAAQLNAYARIAQETGLGTVTGLGLLYYEPITDIAEDGFNDVLTPDGFKLRFQARCVPVALDLASVDRLLAKAAEINALALAPQGRLECKDCAVVDAIVQNWLIHP